MTAVESLPTDPAPAPTEAAHASSFPAVTTGLLVAIALVFAAELMFAIQAPEGLLSPGVVTLQALGGLQYPLVVDQGQWYRLFSAPFLHLDIVHVSLNGLVLFFVGSMLELAVGRLWFAAIYAVGGVAGGLASLALNAYNVVSVGASGAIMAVLAAIFVLSFHFEAGDRRKGMQSTSLRFLIPSLIPLGTSHGTAVDYGAHFGGAVAGAIMGAMLLLVWRGQKPALTNVAAVIAALAVIATGYSALAGARAYPGYSQFRLLIPARQFPENFDDRVSRASALVSQYPHDPRARLARAVALVRARDLAGAEAQMKAGLGEEEILRALMEPAFKTHMQSYLALIQHDEHHLDDARQSARAGCLSESAALHPNLVKAGLCEEAKP
jgi:rhomboid protease GluP